MRSLGAPGSDNLLSWRVMPAFRIDRDPNIQFYVAIEKPRERTVALLGPDWPKKTYKRPVTPEVKAAHDEFFQSARALAELSWESFRSWSLEHRPETD
jgi:hypothetical protein